jgi:ABC transporter substrate binding protein (PQQ-dependent alcohol dehydrogenase system)
MPSARLRWLLLLATLTAPALAQVGTQPVVPTASFVYLSRESAQDARGSLSEPVVADYGWRGAQFAMNELNANGQFLGKHFELTKLVVAREDDLRTRVREVIGQHPALVVADLEPDDLLAVADMAEARDDVIIDARASADPLRAKDCRAGVFHVLPSWKMRADALAHFFIAKQWRRWVLLSGPSADDRAYAAALRSTAHAAGVQLVADAALPANDVDNPLTQAQLDSRIAALTRLPLPYDLVVVTDSAGAVGERVMFNTAVSRLVAGTQGLRATAWDPQFHDFAARGFAYRFAQFASREMNERDYGNWLAVTVLGEAVLRGKVSEPPAVAGYLRSKDFSVAAFKGEPLRFLPGSQQLAQPLLLFGPRVLVALAPDTQQGPAAAQASGCDLHATRQ